jgi:hypothetical protein
MNPHIPFIAVLVVFLAACALHQLYEIFGEPDDLSANWKG